MSHLSGCSAGQQTFLSSQPVANLMRRQAVHIRGSSSSLLAVEGPPDRLRLEMCWACSQASEVVETFHGSDWGEAGKNQTAEGNQREGGGLGRGWGGGVDIKADCEVSLGLGGA